MSISSSPRSSLSGSVFTFATVAVAVFALLSLLGALLAPSANAAPDDDFVGPTQDPFDLSEWESCGDDCIVPEFVCPPGYVDATAGAEPTCAASGKIPVSPLPSLEIIDCPDGQYAAYDVQMTAELWALGGPPLDIQFCSEPIAELLFGPTVSCPAGTEVTDNFFFGGEDGVPLELTDEEIAELLMAEDAMPVPLTEEQVAEILSSSSAPPVSTPAPMPLTEAEMLAMTSSVKVHVVPTVTPDAMMPIALPVDADMAPMPISTPMPLPPMSFPMCRAADGTEFGATFSGFIDLLPFEPECPADARLYATSAGIVCRPENGDDFAPAAVPIAPTVCESDEILIGDDVYGFCAPLTERAYPVCPVGYIAFAESPEAAVICTNDDEIVRDIIAVPPPIAIEDAATEASAILEAAGAAADASDDEQYPSYPSCPSFALLADGTCANIIDGSGMTTSPAATPIPVPISTVVAQQPVVIQQPVAPAPGVVIHPTFKAPMVTHAAANYGFGNQLPAMTTHATDTKATAATLAHTGAETNTLLYFALSMIAAGSVLMGSRRRESLR